MKEKGIRASANLGMLKTVARKLGHLNDEVVYVGGCAAALIMDDPLVLDVRETVDVDCIVEIASYPSHVKFENKLREIGLTQSQEDEIRCRWRCEGIIVDIMPTDEKVLGFSNAWYKEALHHAESHFLSEDLLVKSISAPYFLATKIDAFRSRGKNDFLGSHDFEDIISVISGRLEIINEISVSNEGLKSHIVTFLNQILKSDQFEQSLPGHLNDGPVTRERVIMVMDRIRKIANDSD